MLFPNYKMLSVDCCLMYLSLRFDLNIILIRTLFTRCVPYNFQVTTLILIGFTSLKNPKLLVFSVHNSSILLMRGRLKRKTVSLAKHRYRIGAFSTTVWGSLNFSKPEWQDPQKTIIGMTVFVLLDSDGTCTFFLPLFRNHTQYLAILQV